MKKLLAIAIALGTLAPAFAQTSVGVSIGINQPGVYGRIDIGNFPQPQLIYAQPILIAPPVRYVQQQPVYLYVPPGHQKNWGKALRALQRLRPTGVLRERRVGA